MLQVLELEAAVACDVLEEGDTPGFAGTTAAGSRGRHDGWGDGRSLGRHGTVSFLSVILQRATVTSHTRTCNRTRTPNAASGRVLF